MSYFDISFHTTMVLTQPFCFDSRTVQPVCKFPYHYGSYATKIIRGRIASWWLFPYHYGSYATSSISVLSMTLNVSIPLWFLRNNAMWNIRKAMRNVSIPLWFLRNTRTAGLEFLLTTTFPYHYGSYATIYHWKANLPTHLVFPYHYGSYATDMQIVRKIS